MHAEGKRVGDGALDRIVRDLKAVAFRQDGQRPWRFERVWGNTEAILGCHTSAVASLDLRQLLPAEDWERVVRASNTVCAPGECLSVVVRVRRCDGSLLPVAARAWRVFDDDGQPQALEGYAVPLDDADAHVRLMRGFIHDLNNILSAAMWGVVCGGEMATGNAALTELLAGTEKAIRSASDLARQMSRMGAPLATHTAVVDRVVRGMLPLLRCLVGPHIELLADLQADGAAVELGSSELERIVLNLTTNARDAMARSGTVGLRSSLCDSGASRCVRLELSDTGPGVTTTSMPQLLEAGMTSRPPGKGLGLSIVNDLVRCAGGYIDVSNSAEGGAAFRVTLPVADGATDACGDEFPD